MSNSPVAAASGAPASVGAVPALARLAVLTTGRQDYGLLRSTLRLFRTRPEIELQVFVGGMHLRSEFGATVKYVRADGFDVCAELPFLSDAGDVLHETATAMEQIGRALASHRSDALLLVGDRSETLAAAVAATLVRVPIIHIHGGEESEGAIDNAMRHAITKLAHLHLVSHRAHAARVLQMGEDPASVVVVGAPGLDNLYRADLPDRTALEARFGRSLRDPLVLVTVHPTTLGALPLEEVQAVTAAMARVPARYIVTGPNADPGGTAIRQFWDAWVPAQSDVVFVDALGEDAFWGVLKIAAAVVGNSSGGLIEVPAAGLPVINVGDRQRGRLRPVHVVDVPADADAIEGALRAAVRPETRARLSAAEALYPAGEAAPRIVGAITAWQRPVPPRKRFRERP